MRYWHFLIDRLHYLIAISVVILAILTFRISSISNEFLAQTFDSEQRLRAVIKINMIFHRGIGKSVMAFKVNDQDMLYDGIDLIESTIGYISTKDYFTDELNNTLIQYIDTVIGEIEEINAGYLQKGVPVPREAIMKISDISDEMFRLLSKEDFDNWNKLSYDNSKLSGQFKHIRTLIIIILIIVSTMLVVLIRSLRFRKNAENALKDAHDKLEIKVQERTQELSELNINLEQDITERKRAEEALKESEEKFRALFDYASDSILLMRLEKGGVPTIVDVNAATCSMHGYSKEELIGQPISMLDDPETAEQVKEWARRVLAGESLTFEGRHVRKDGTVFPVEVSTCMFNIGKDKYVLAIDRDITERKRAKAEISSIYNAISDFITVQDTEYRILNYNRAVENVWGKDLKGKLCYEAYQGRSDICPDCAVKRAIDSKKPEFTSQTSTDTSPPVEIYAYPIIDDSNEVVAVVEHGRDITERKRAEEALKESEEKFRSAFDNAGIGMVMSTLNGDFLKVNDSFCSLLGHTEDELLKMNFRDFTHPEDLEIELEYAEKLLKGEIERFEMEKRYVHKDGGIIWIILNISMVKDIEGNIQYAIGQAQDITERKQAEEKILKSEEQLLKAQEIAGLGFWDLDLITGELYWSDAIYGMLGFKPGEVVPNYEIFKDRVHPDDRDRVQKHVDAALNDDIHYNIDFRYLFPTGEVRYVNPQAEVTRDENGKAIRFFGTQQDITERKLAEEEIKKSLREKNILLKEVHHRVKNNLAVIISLFKLQANVIDDEKVIAIFNESQNRIKSMALVHEKLYQTGDFTHIDLGDYINTLASRIIDSGYARGSKVNCHVDVDDTELSIDALIPLGLLLNEIITNSLKHAFKGRDEGEITISLTSQGEDKTLVITDNGVGIPEGLDIYNTKTLGLQLVTALTRQLKGEIELDRKKGTRFTISFKKV